MSEGTVETGWNVYRAGPLTHLMGANPGTPYTMCGLDAGDMKRDWHSPFKAALWCTECFKAAIAPPVGGGDE